MTLQTKVAIAAGAALLLYLGYRAYGGVPDSSTDAAPDGSVQLSSFVMKNNQCYRVDLYASGAKRSVEVPNSFCCNDNPDLPGCR